MKKIDIGKRAFEVSEIALGLMRISDKTDKEIVDLISTALENNIDFFDHADIYGGGRSEELFAKAIKEISVPREDIILQSKCGITNGTFDFSKNHILLSVDKILKRLNTDYLDVLLLHRPDTLMEPSEIAEAFNELSRSGKVKRFGVSNQNPMQMELLKRYLKDPLIINQLQFSITNCGMIDSGLNVNMENDATINRDGSILEYCRINDVTIQAWSPLTHGFFEGTFIGSEKYIELNRVLNRIADEKEVTSSCIAIAWILRHPAKIQPIIGTTNAKRLDEICKASDIILSRKEWYEIYLAAGKKLP